MQVPITAWLVLSSLAGIPLGLLLLRTAAAPVVKGVLGGVVGAFAAASLLNRGAYELKNDPLAWLFASCCWFRRRSLHDSDGRLS